MMSSNSGVVRQILPDSATRARTGTASCYTASSLSLVEIGTRLRSPYTVFSVHSDFFISALARLDDNIQNYLWK